MAAGGVQFRQNLLELFAGSNGCGIGCVGGDGDLGKGRVLEREQFSLLIQLPSVVSRIPATPELHENPVARIAWLAPQLRGKRMAIELHPFRQLGTGQIGKGWQQFAEVDQIVANTTCRKRSFPTGDQWHARASFEQRPFPAIHPLTTDAARDLRGIMLCGISDGRGAVVGREQYQRALAQTKLLERCDNLANRFVEILQVVVVELCRGCVRF